MKKDQGSDSLYRLVHSLDANERGYVKKFLKRHSSKGNVNLDLVEVLENQKEYDETSLKKKIKNLAVIKVQTWDEIMDALRLYRRKNSTFDSSSISDQITILTEKGFREQALKLADSYVQKYYETNEFYSLINLLSIRSRYGYYHGLKKSEPEIWDENMAEIISVIEKLKEVHIFVREVAKFYYIHQQYIKAPIAERQKYVKEIQALKKKSSLFSKEPTTVYSQMQFYNLNSYYYDILSQPEKSIQYLELCDTLIKEKMKNFSGYERFVIDNSIYLISTYLRTNEYPKARKQLSVLEATPINNKLQDEKRNANTLYMRLYLHNHTKDLKLLNLLIEKSQKEITSTAQHHVFLATANHFKIEYLISLLLLEKYTEASRWILECDNDKTFRTDDINYQWVLVIEVVLNYVLNDVETAEKSAKKHAKNKEFQLAKLFKALTISDKKKRGIELKEAMQNTKEKSNLLLEYFDVFDWIMKVLK